MYVIKSEKMLDWWEEWLFLAGVYSWTQVLTLTRLSYLFEYYTLQEEQYNVHIKSAQSYRIMDKLTYNSDCNLSKKSADTGSWILGRSLMARIRILKGADYIELYKANYNI